MTWSKISTRMHSHPLTKASPRKKLIENFVGCKTINNKLSAWHKQTYFKNPWLFQQKREKYLTVFNVFIACLKCGACHFFDISHIVPWLALFLLNFENQKCWVFIHLKMWKSSLISYSFYTNIYRFFDTV